MAEIIKMQNGLRSLSVMDVARPEAIAKQMNTTGYYLYGMVEMITLGDTKNIALSRLTEMDVIGDQVYIYKNINEKRMGFTNIELELIIRAITEQYLYGRNREETKLSFMEYFHDQYQDKYMDWD